MSRTRQSVAGIAIAVFVGILVSWAGSDGSVEFGSVPVFAICGAVAFLINWIAFIPSYAARTEKYYDLTGSITYVTVTVMALSLSGQPDARALVAGVFVITWAIRLGTYLFRRIRREGRDGRFDKVKTEPLRFLMFWTVQGLWVLLTAAPALAIMTSDVQVDLGWVAFLGIAVWVTGFATEVIADRQKSAFRNDPANEGRFISTGLWAWSRHPNYFGEIVLWTGMAVIALPILSGWRWMTLISPIFVTLLLTRFSGIPPLERRSDQRWGEEVAYQLYKESTPVLVPRPPRTP